jgi:hypothetical protein
MHERSNVDTKKPDKGGRRKGSPRPPGSGRKKGTPNKVTSEVKLIAQQYGEEAIATLARIMRTSDNDADRTNAIKELLNRGYGRAPNPVHLAGWNGGPLGADFIKNMSNEELDALIPRLAAAAAKPEPTEH